MPPFIDTRRGRRHHRGDGGRRSSNSGTALQRWLRDRAPRRGVVRGDVLPPVLRIRVRPGWDGGAVRAAGRGLRRWLAARPEGFLFGGVATVVVVALVGLTRRERPLGRAFLA